MTEKVKLIAEIGANYNGDMSLAKEMIFAAKENGADYAKFQSWKESNIPLGPWDDNEPFFGYKNKRDFYKKAQLLDDQHYELIEFCNKVGIKFLTTCFDRGRVEFLSKLGLDTIKVSSVDSTSLSMLEDLSKDFNRLIVSTGMASTKEVQQTINFLSNLDSKFSMLYCVALYPTPFEKISLNRMLWLRQALVFSGDFGISDHTLGTTASQVAIAHGAKWVEKHFTIDNNIPGPDNVMSITPKDLKEIRVFADNFCLMQSNDSLEPDENELELRKIIEYRFGNNK